MTLFPHAAPDPSEPRPTDASELAIALFDAAPVPMWIFDRESLRFMEVNANAIARYGYTREEFLRLRISDLRVPDDEARACEAARAPQQGVGRHTEPRHRWKDGSVRDVAVVTYDITYQDRPARLVMVDDVTERVAAEHSRTLLLTAIEQLDELVLVFEPNVDPDGPPHISYANVAVERTLGVPRRASPGPAYHPDRTPPELVALRDLIAPALDCDRTTRRELVWTSPTGRGYRPETAAAPVRAPDGRGVSHWAGVARDVTEQRALADRSAQAQRLESLGLLAGSIAHDFNNLVHVVTGFSELALTQLPAKGASTAYIQQAHEAALRAAGLAKQLLAFSRRQQLKAVRLDLRALLDALRPVLVRLAGPRVQFVLSGGAEPAMVCADPTQMEQIFLNLVVNARDAQPEGGRVEIVVDVVTPDDLTPDQLPSEAASARFVRVRVSDAGPGMPADVQARVFEPFFTTKPQGTGLGLSTVHGIVRQSGGSITLSSRPGKGLTATIVLPEAAPP